MNNSRKIPKTLSGIETIAATQFELADNRAGKYLKPYQGLKQPEHPQRLPSSRRKIPKTLSGIETENGETLSPELHT